MSQSVSRLLKVGATLLGAVLALVSFATIASAAGLVGPEEETAEAGVGPALQVEPLTPEAAASARTIAEQAPGLRGLLNPRKVAAVSQAPVHDEAGRLRAVLLTYEMKEKLHGRPDFVVLPTPPGKGVGQGRFDVGIRSARAVDVIVDLASRSVESVLPGTGTEYEAPVAGQRLTLADGTDFVFTDSNFTYDPATGSIALHGIESDE